MNSRISILLISGAAVIVLIALVIVVFVSGSSADQRPASAEKGSLLDPEVRRDARDGYVIAELYQDVHLDVASGVYDEDGVLLGHHWTHDPARQTCGIDLVVAVQEGMDQAPPAATPRPTDTPLPTDPPWHPQEYSVIERTIETVNGAGIAVALLPTPRADWPTSTPRPDLHAVPDRNAVAAHLVGELDRLAGPTHFH